MQIVLGLELEGKKLEFCIKIGLDIELRIKLGLAHSLMISHGWHKKGWKGLKGIFKIGSEVNDEGLSLQETRYFITSLNTSASFCLYFARTHRTIENGLHRTLSANLKEGHCQVHDRNAASN